jgi:hypothetical protein
MNSLLFYQNIKITIQKDYFYMMEPVNTVRSKKKELVALMMANLVVFQLKKDIPWKQLGLK